MGRSRLINLNIIHILIGIFFTAHILSVLFSVNKNGSFWGKGDVFVSPDSTLGIIFFIFLFLISYYVSKQSLKATVVLSSILVFLMFTGSLLLIPETITISSLLGISIFGGLLQIQHIKLDKKLFKLIKYLLWIISVLFLALPIVFGVKYILIILIFFSLFLIIYFYVTKSKLYWPTFVLLFLIITRIIFLNTGFISETNILKNNPQGFVIDNETSLDISIKTLNEFNPLFGIGPDNFNIAWNLFLPTEKINNTKDWDINVNYASSYPLNLLTTSGILGFMSFSLFLLILLLIVKKTYIKPIDNHYIKVLIIFTSFGTVIFWTSVLLLPVSVVLLSLSFIFSGLFLGLSSLVDGIKNYPIKLDKKVFYSSVFLLVLISLFITYGYLIKFIAYYNYEKGNYFLAVNVLPTEVYYQNLGSFGNAIFYNDKNYINFLNLAVENRSLIKKENSSSENALYYSNAYLYLNNVLMLRPDYPRIFLEFAKLEVSMGEHRQARHFLSEALEMKEDYIEAIDYWARLELERTNFERSLELFIIAFKATDNLQYKLETLSDLMELKRYEDVQELSKKVISSSGISKENKNKAREYFKESTKQIRLLQ